MPRLATGIEHLTTPSSPRAPRPLPDPAVPEDSMSTSMFECQSTHAPCIRGLCRPFPPFLSCFFMSYLSFSWISRPAHSSDRTESKAVTTWPLKTLLAMLPKLLHRGMRASKHYTTRNDCLLFQAQESRDRAANADDNRAKLVDEVLSVYRNVVPGETGSDKVKKFEAVYVLFCLRLPMRWSCVADWRRRTRSFHNRRLESKKNHAAKKQSRRGPSE